MEACRDSDVAVITLLATAVLAAVIIGGFFIGAARGVRPKR